VDENAILDAMRTTKRQLGVGIVSVGMGGLLVNASTGTTQAVSLSGEVSIPDKEKRVQDAVDGARLSVNGSFGWESDTLPSNAVLRIKVARSGAFEQLAAEQYNTDLSTDHTQEFAIDGINLLDHSRLTVADLNPTSIGETKTVELQTRLLLEVNANGHTLESAKQTDAHTIQVTKSQGQTSINMETTGSITLHESD